MRENSGIKTNAAKAYLQVRLKTRRSLSNIPMYMLRYRRVERRPRKCGLHISKTYTRLETRNSPDPRPAKQQPKRVIKIPVVVVKLSHPMRVGMSESNMVTFRPYLLIMKLLKNTPNSLPTENVASITEINQ